MDPRPRGQVPEKRSWCRGLLRQGCWWGDECLYFHIDDWVDGQTGQKMLLYKDKKQLGNILTTGLRNAGRQGDHVLSSLQRSLPRCGYQQRVTWESLEESICLICETLHRDTEGSNANIREICKYILFELRPYIECSSKQEKKEPAKNPEPVLAAELTSEFIDDDDSDGGEVSVNTPYFQMMMKKMSSDIGQDVNMLNQVPNRLPLWMRKESGESTLSTNNPESATELSPTEETELTEKHVTT